MCQKKNKLIFIKNNKIFNNKIKIFKYIRSKKTKIKNILKIVFTQKNYHILNVYILVGMFYIILIFFILLYF